MLSAIIFAAVALVLGLLAALFTLSALREASRDRAWARRQQLLQETGRIRSRSAIRPPSLHLVGANSPGAGADAVWSWGQEEDEQEATPDWEFEPLPGHSGRPGSEKWLAAGLGLTFALLALAVGFFAVRLLYPSAIDAFDIPFIDVPWVKIPRAG